MLLKLWKVTVAAAAAAISFLIYWVRLSSTQRVSFNYKQSQDSQTSMLAV